MSEINKIKAKFFLNFASPCNMNYHQSLNEDIRMCVYSEEELLRYAEYIKYIISENQDLQNRIKCVIISGGYALQNIDNLIFFAKNIKDSVDYFYLNINDSFNKEQHIDKLYKLWNVLGSKLQLDVYYNFNINEEINKHFFQTLKMLTSRGLATFCTIRIKPSNANNITKLFDNFISSFKDNDIKFYITLDPKSTDCKDFDVNTIESSLKIISEYLTNNIAYANRFSYVPHNIFRSTIKNVSLMHGNIIVMTENGVLYPGYDIQFMDDNAKEKYILGYITEDFKELEAKRNDIIKKYEYDSHKKRTSKDVFKCVPWDTDTIENIHPSEQTCILHDILLKHLSDVYIIYINSV